MGSCGVVWSDMSNSPVVVRRNVQHGGVRARSQRAAGWLERPRRWWRRLARHFTAPPSAPAAMYFCARTSSTTAGTAEITALAMTGPQLCTLPWR
ncbi:Uncharacterised protein [Mycobacteroides abscessus]|nr:Uncharacterised protein [Mycobacteroides abscessus]